jgi:hypothetical protein
MVVNLEFDILTVGNLEFDILTVGNLEFDILTVGNLEFHIFAVGNSEVGETTRHRLLSVHGTLCRGSDERMACSSNN